MNRIDFGKTDPEEIDCGQYILDENGNPVPEPNLHKWGRWFQTADRHVAKDSYGGLDVSTIFLGLKHCSNNFDDDEGGYLFETMVFGDEELIKEVTKSPLMRDSSIFAKFLGCTDIQRRYKTRAEALEGHAEILKLVKETLIGRN